MPTELQASRITTHQSVARLSILSGCIAGIVGVFYAFGVTISVVPSIVSSLVFFVGGSTLAVFGVSLCIPTYFIGQELIDDGGLGLVVFLYLTASVLAVGTLSILAISVEPIRRFGLIFIFVSSLGLYDVTQDDWYV